MIVAGENALRVRDWIAEWFERRGKQLPHAGSVIADVDYLESGLIDSVSMIEFIMDVESEFRIRLTSPMMADPRFSRLAGLVEIIVEASARP